MSREALREEDIKFILEHYRDIYVWLLMKCHKEVMTLEEILDFLSYNANLMELEQHLINLMKTSSNT